MSSYTTKPVYLMPEVEISFEDDVYSKAVLPEASLDAPAKHPIIETISDMSFTHTVYITYRANGDPELMSKIHSYMEKTLKQYWFTNDKIANRVLSALKYRDISDRG